MVTSNKKLALVGGIVGAAVALSAVGLGSLVVHQRQQASSGHSSHSQNPSSSTQGSSQAAVPLQAKLSSAMYAHLSSYADRINHVAHLPIPVNGENVIYISPASGYAISQFHQVWFRIHNVTVVWLDTTATQAQKDWKSLGYAQDPLPSPNTQYVTRMIPEPDSYHLTKKGWIELPGILKPSQTSDWMTFFHTNTVAITSATIKNNVQSPTTSTTSAIVSTNPWKSMTVLSTAQVSRFKSLQLINSSGHTVSLDMAKPTLFVTYWCEWCHHTLQVLSKHHLLSRVQIVALGYQKSDTIRQAKQDFSEAVKKINVNISGQSIDYALPNSNIGSLVKQYPTFIAPHQGHWYQNLGYNPDVQFWATITK